MNETTTAGPPTLDHVVGQHRAVQQLRTAIEATINDRAVLPRGAESPALGHVLLVGPPGVGKSTLSQILSRELGSNCHEELAQNISTPAQLQGLMMLADAGDVVFCDEIHELNPMVQTTLYRCLEERRLFLPSGANGARNSVTLPPVTFIGATTDEFKLSRPLRDRFKLIVRLEYYSDEELSKLLSQRARRLGWSVEDAAIQELAIKGRGTPRIAIRFLEASRRVSRSVGADSITAEHVRRMMEVEGVDALGLDCLEQKYLAILSESASPIRLNIIASRIGIPRRSLEEVVEEDLLRLGLITKDDEGRMLTAAGRQHVRGSTSAK